MFISIIIPMYNSEKTIVRCIKSIINNKGKIKVEIVIVNDGSTDNSVEVINEFLRETNFDSIKLYNKENGGVSSARNFGISKANGEYIWFIDSDDEISNDAFDNLLKEYSEGYYDIIKFNYLIEKIPGKIFVRGKKVNKNIPKNFVKNYTLNSPCTQLYKKDLLKDNNLKFNEKISYGEDFLFNLNAYSITDRIKVINKYLYLYRKSPNSITRNNTIEKLSKRLFDVMNSYGKLYKYQSVFSFTSEDIKQRIYKESVNVLILADNKHSIYKLINNNQKILNEKNIDASMLYSKCKRKLFLYKIKKNIKEMLK